MRMVTLLTLITLLCSVRLASADFFDDCVRDCAKTHDQCVADITLFDQTGINEAKEACLKDQQGCRAACHGEDAKRNEESSQERAAKEAEAEEQKRQAQRETLNGTIGIYQFGE